MGGFFGVLRKDEECVTDLFYGTDYHSHLGTRRAGMATLHARGFDRIIHDISNTQFRSKFDDDLAQFKGCRGIGVISDFEDQPLLIGSHLGAFGLVTVGVVRNLSALVSQAFAGRSTHFSEMNGGDINPTELVATLINRGASFVEGLAHAQSVIEGSCSVLLLTREGLYAMRDRYGRTPVVIGRRGMDLAITFETCALHNLGFAIEHYLGPGEIVRLTEEGWESVQPPGDTLRICSFLWIYYGYPSSSYETINVEQARNRCGEVLARRDPTDADFVSGIPDSGIAHALGYAAAAGKPYRRAYVKYTPTWPRSFLPGNQAARELVARMKLMPVRELIEGQRIIFCEDSIVRGTQLREAIRRIYACGAREVHMRSACPPLMYRCPYLNFSRARSEMELATRQAIDDLEGNASPGHLAEYCDPDSERHARMVARIGERLGVDSLRYQRLEDMQAAIGLPPEKLCDACWTGTMS